MATGWAGDDAVQQQIDATVEDAVQRARRRLATGPGRETCEECEPPIPLARQQPVPGVPPCAASQQAAHAAGQAHAGYNRRGSKDSQLR